MAYQRHGSSSLSFRVYRCLRQEAYHVCTVLGKIPFIADGSQSQRIEGVSQDWRASQVSIIV